MKRYRKIRWLSRWHVITPPYDLLESIIICLQEVDESESIVAKFILEKLGQYEYIYILYFFVDILYSLAMLSKVFQLKFVDVITVDIIIRTKISQIYMLILVI